MADAYAIPDRVGPLVFCSICGTLLLAVDQTYVECIQCGTKADTSGNPFPPSIPTTVKELMRMVWYSL